MIEAQFVQTEERQEEGEQTDYSVQDYKQSTFSGGFSVIGAQSARTWPGSG